MSTGLITKGPGPRPTLPPHWLFTLAVMLAGGFLACANERTTSPRESGDKCIACHTSRERLTATAVVDTTTPPEDPGEG